MINMDKFPTNKLLFVHQLYKYSIMNNQEVRLKLDRILNELKKGKLTPQEAHEAMKPLNELISRATSSLHRSTDIARD